MEYREFLKLPEVKVEFDAMLSERKEYFARKSYSNAFDKVHLELFCIKMAFMATDTYFTQKHNTMSKKSITEDS